MSAPILKVPGKFLNNSKPVHIELLLSGELTVMAAAEAQRSFSILPRIFSLAFFVQAWLCH